MVHDFQQIDRVAAQRTDGGGIVHALVIGAGDARRHGVLDDVDAGVDRDLFGLIHTGLPVASSISLFRMRMNMFCSIVLHRLFLL